MKKVIAAIQRHKRFLVTAHVNLEGDSLGSQLAMGELLKSIGKEAVIVDSDHVPDHYKFLPKAGEIVNSTDALTGFDAVVVLDCPTLNRVGRLKEAITKGRAVINIDHHISNERFGEVNWVDPDASSAGEMVYRLFKEMGTALTKETALCLYIAILTDTGSFNYVNTSSVTHEIAGELLGYGLEPALVSENVYEHRSVADIKLLGRILSSIKLNKRGDIAYLELTKKILRETGADISKSEGIVNYARSVESVKAAILFKEDLKDPAKINVSFRSKGGVDVNKIASHFGGGGHMRASGCVVKGSLAQVEKKVLARVEEELRKNKT